MGHCQDITVIGVLAVYIIIDSLLKRRIRRKLSERMRELKKTNDAWNVIMKEDKDK